MKAINLIEDNEGQKFCILDPSLCLRQSQGLQYSSLIECKYCKSIYLPKLKANKSQCLVCKCFTQVKQYSGLVPMLTSNIIITKVPQKINNNQHYNNKEKNKLTKSVSSNLANKHKIRLLIVYQSKLQQQFCIGLQCFKELFPKYSQIMQICLILYDTEIRLVQLQQDGRVIVMNEDSLQLINDRFYQITTQSINQMLQVIQMMSTLKTKQTTLNCTKTMIEILKNIPHRQTVVLWFGQLNQKMQFYSYPKYPNIDVYAILKISYYVKLHSQMEVLNQLNKNSTKTKFILKAEKDDTITEKIHYQIYQMFWNQPIFQIKVEASRQRKYPPEILTNKQKNMGNLKNCIVVKLGKVVQKQENIQVRIKYTEIQTEQQEQKEQLVEVQIKQDQQEDIKLLNKRQNKQKLLKETKHKILIINFQFPANLPKPTLFACRYLQLFKFVKINPTNVQLRSIPLKNNIDIDICQYFRQCCYLNKQDLFANIENPNCIYVVWPLIATKINSYGKKSVQFVYFFIGFSLSNRLRKMYRKQTDSNQLQNNQPYKQEIQQLNRLCQVLYCPYEKNMLVYYENLIQDVQPSHLQNSDGQSDGQQLDNRYYEYKIKTNIC